MVWMLHWIGKIERMKRPLPCAHAADRTQNECNSTAKSVPPAVTRASLPLKNRAVALRTPNLVRVHNDELACNGLAQVDNRGQQKCRTCRDPPRDQGQCAHQPNNKAPENGRHTARQRKL
eukprot:6458291-Amphidinium_carterae.4